MRPAAPCALALLAFVRAASGSPVGEGALPAGGSGRPPEGSREVSGPDGAPAPAPRADPGVDPGGQARAPSSDHDEAPSRFADSVLEWGHAATAQTLGLGASYQSANPTYEMSLALAPRFRVAGDAGSQAFVAGRLELVREWTNSDVTTRRGETTLSDAVLFGGYGERLHRRAGHETTLGVRAPILTFPTSTFSSQNGTILGLGAGLSVQQKVPLAQGSARPSVAFRAGAEYTHTFTEAVVPTNPELRRDRMDPEGRTVPGDQLTGAAFPAHELRLGLRGTLNVTERLAWLVDVSYRPVWKYELDAKEVCVATGCEPLAPSRDPSRYIVVTGFATEISYALIDAVSVALAYSNVATQPGPDGQRRSVFYSPGAQLALTLALHLDALDPARSAETSGAPGRRVAAREDPPAPR